MLSCNFIFLFGRETTVALRAGQGLQEHHEEPIQSWLAIQTMQYLGGSYVYPKVQHSGRARDLSAGVMLPPSLCYQKDSHQILWTHPVSPAFVPPVWGMGMERTGGSSKKGTVQNSVSKWRQHEWWQQNLERTLKTQDCKEKQMNELLSACCSWTGVTA